MMMTHIAMNSVLADAEIEITPEMIEAGAYVLDDRYGIESGTMAQILAREVFCEMIAASLERRGGSDSSASSGQ